MLPHRKPLFNTPEDDMFVILYKSDSNVGFLCDGHYKRPVDGPTAHNYAQIFNGGAISSYSWNTPGIQYPPEADTDAKKMTYWNKWIDSLGNL
jgi:hypothetical protein